MIKSDTYPVTDSLGNAHINLEQYESMYRESLDDPDAFWSRQASDYVSWFEPWETVHSYEFENGNMRWFEGGKLNASNDCLDRHLEKRGDQTAIIWEGDPPDDSSEITYRRLHGEVCRFANALKARGVVKGDRVVSYLPMITEAVIAMLACARIGTVPTVVFAGFPPDALKDRLLDAESRVVITANEALRGGREVSLKDNVDQAVSNCPDVDTVFVVQQTASKCHWNEERDLWWHEACAKASIECEPEPMEAEDPLFILDTSGSTGKPKRVLHTTGGYPVYVAMTHKLVFDYREGDVYWCTADVGWVTGHSYIVNGPLCNGATTQLFEGVPTWPYASRCWNVVDGYQVNIFYTAPTLIRALMAKGDEYVNSTSRSSLRILGTVGELTNPEVWEWYYNTVDDGRCPIVDTCWQTETGGHMLTSLPGATSLKPGSATKAFFGVEPALLDEQGREVEGEGRLVIKRSCPGQMSTIYGDHKRFVETYFSMCPGYYFSGDGARRDADSDYWIAGRIDDVINISSQRLGTAEIESAVVGFPHDLKGQGIYAYVTLMSDVRCSNELQLELVSHVRKLVAPEATPDLVQWAPGLPKTRSGKIMRRILRKVAANEIEDLGDTSTLANPAVVENLITNRMNL